MTLTDEGARELSFAIITCAMEDYLAVINGKLPPVWDGSRHLPVIKRNLLAFFRSPWFEELNYTGLTGEQIVKLMDEGKVKIPKWQKRV